MTVGIDKTKSGILFQVYSFSADELKKNDKRLSHTLNKGYNVPRYEFGIITTSRIKESHTAYEDLKVVPNDKCYAVFCFSDKDPDNEEIIVNEDENIDDAHITKEKLLKLYPKGTIDVTKWNIEYDQSIDKTSNKFLKFPDNFSNRFLGMGCIKPYHNSMKTYELTGFVSFYPRIGSQLIKCIEEISISKLELETILAIAIREHLLNEMYEKFGYTFVESLLVKAVNDEDDENGVESEILEQGVKSTRDFHLDVFKKQLM